MGLCRMFLFYVHGIRPNSIVRKVGSSMKKCLKIKVLGKVQGVSYRAFVQKHAQALGIEGAVQNADDGSIIIFACGLSDCLDKLIDNLYKGNAGSVINDLVTEPIINEKNFRGVFRIIGD
jgi:acylphosphatase